MFVKSRGFLKMLLKEVSYTHQGCIYLIKNTAEISIIVKYYYILNKM